MKTDLEHVSNPIAHMDKYVLHITGYGFSRRYVALRSSGFHEAAESTIINGLEGPLAFRNPTNEFSTDECVLDVVIILEAQRYTLRFHLRMLAMAVGDLSFSYAFKGCGY